MAYNFLMANVVVAAISGSLRAGSINTALIHASQRLAPEGLEIRHVSIADLPVYNMDLEGDFPAAVTEFKNQVKAADGVLFTVPEHNFSFPGVLKNAIDWGSRPYGEGCWDGKPVIMQSASPMWTGGIRGQYQLLQVLGYFEMKHLRFPEIFVGGRDKFKDGELVDALSMENITKQLAAFKSFIEASRAS